MSAPANVHSIDALKEFRAALIEFSEDTRLGLSEALNDVQRTVWWVTHDQPAHWQRELRKRTNRLNECKTDLARVQMQNVSTVLEKKKLLAAQQAVDEAEDKLRRAKHWSTALERELMMFKGQCNALAGTIDGELPSVVARMDRMIEALFKYVALQAPTSESRSAIGAAAASASEASDGSGVSGAVSESSGGGAEPSGSDGAEHAGGGG
jgi:hypothetical protein